MPCIGAVSIETTGTVILALVTNRAVRVVTRVAFSNGGPETWLTGLAVCRIGHATDAVWIRAGKCDSGNEYHQ